MEHIDLIRAIAAAQACARGCRQRALVGSLLNEGMNPHVPTAMNLPAIEHRRPQYVRSAEASWKQLEERLLAAGFAVAVFVNETGHRRLKLVLDPVVATLVRDGRSYEDALCAAALLS